MNSHSIKARDRIIVALDVSTQAEALDLVGALSGEASFFKIGLQLYTRVGPEIIRAVRATGARVFLDLKLHDIPNTVSRSVLTAAELGVEMLTIHLSGGRAMIEAAVRAKTENLLLLGVTVLTSADDDVLRETGISPNVEEQVLRLAELGVMAGIGGLIASPHEAALLRGRFGDKIRIVTPGVRPVWAAPDDQKRFMTPKDALRNGADYLVIGRPITAHAKPREAFAKIVAELPQ